MIETRSDSVAVVLLAACCLAVLVTGCSEKEGGARFTNTPLHQKTGTPPSSPFASILINKHPPNISRKWVPKSVR